VKADEIDVRLVPLDLPPERLADLERLLSPDERARAARYRFPRDRDRFMAGRGSLREILGAYLDAEPAGVELAYGPHGKPHLAGKKGTLGFNLAHADGLAVVAAGRGRRIGVDIEAVRPTGDLEDLARHAFSPVELEVFRGLPFLARMRAFYHCWTRKEAYVKALGTGFSTALDAFDVSLSPDEPARLLAVRDGGPGPDCWVLEDLPVGPGFAAALAFDGGPARIRFVGRPRRSRVPAAGG
jgi:4'-phosphopantetheinyl transferase